MHYIESAASDGAHVAQGGRRSLQETGGYFIDPTILTNVPVSARAAREEIFGPVLAVIPFRDEREAVRIANDTIYGLAAYVWTSKVSTAMRMAKQLCSSVWINAAAPMGEGAGHAASAEPSRQSGVGIEGGLAGMESYLRRQLICVNHG
jgi:acyl-CoA reductase-like NAD-dependent aldehyde dehydrogenase